MKFSPPAVDRRRLPPHCIKIIIH